MSLRYRGRHRPAMLLSIVLALAGIGVPGAASAEPAGPPHESAGFARPVVAVAQGRIRGMRAAGVDKFLGIPYAAAPTGSLRWRPPTDARPWTGLRDASAFGPTCPQFASINGPESLDEDCLRVNVFRPTGVDARHRLPVYFFIHGGGLVTGSANQIDATRTAQDNRIVVVTINYRLGVLGFLGHPSLRDATGASGNYGLMDQQAALRWTGANITAFGGDPRNITLGGQSAGAGSVCAHLVSPAVRGLFHRAVMQSGNCTATTPAVLEASGGAFAAAAGCADPAAAAQCLRSKPIPELLATALSAPATILPVVDGHVIPGAPLDLIRSGSWHRVPVILGANHDERRIYTFLDAAFPLSADDYVARVRALAGVHADTVLAAYPLSDFADPSTAWSIVQGDAGIVCRNIFLATEFARASAVWHYEFDDRTAPGQLVTPEWFPLRATRRRTAILLCLRLDGPAQPVAGAARRPNAGVLDELRDVGVAARGRRAALAEIHRRATPIDVIPGEPDHRTG